MNRLQTAIVLGAGLFLSMVLLLHQHSGEPDGALPRPAPQFDLPRSDGTRISLSSLRGKTLLVHFWATWCPPCVDESPRLEALHRRLGPRGLLVLAISVDDGWDAVQRFVSAYGVSYPVLLDPTAASARRFGTVKYPETYLVDGAGRIVRKYVGPRDWMEPELVAELTRSMESATATP